MWTSRIVVANSTPRKLKRRAGQNIRRRTPSRPSRAQADAGLVLRVSARLSDRVAAAGSGGGSYVGRHRHSRTVSNRAAGGNAAPDPSLCIRRRVTCLCCIRGEPLYVGRRRLDDCADFRRRAGILDRRRHRALRPVGDAARADGRRYLIAVGLLRAGWLATLLSTPVTTGFLAG